MSSFTSTVRETARYRGRWGHWSWVAHRVSGLAVLSFLIIHVWDTANATFAPATYAYTVELFKWFPFSVGEIFLMAAVLYHAFNGIRVSILDYWPHLWKYQQPAATMVWLLFMIIFVPLGLFMFSRTLGHCRELAAVGASCWTFPTP